MSETAGADASAADELSARFLGRAEAVGSVAHACSGWREAAWVALDLADGAPIVMGPRAAEATELRAALAEPSGDAVIVTDPEDPLAAAVDAPVGVAVGELGVAETGSVAFDESQLADRAVSMLSQTLVQFVPADRVVASLDDVAEWLAGEAAGPGYRTLVSGPSRTADIERSLTVGVQGPSEVHVVVVGEQAVPRGTARGAVAGR